jgi:hypothetical protein
VAEKKYEKCIVTEPFMKPDPESKMPKRTSGPSLMAHSGELGAECSIAYHCYPPQDEPMEFLIPHSHDCHQFLCFLAGNSEDISDFGADIEITLGEEKEVYYINKTSIVSIPPGLLHCPLIFRKITKPLIFLEVTLESEYEKVIDEDSLARLSPEERKRLPSMVLKNFSPEVLEKYGLKVEE